MTGESLFWRTTTTQLTKEEFEFWRSPEQTGLRLVDSVTAWMATALEKLPEEYRAWFRIDFDRPEWIDTEMPEQALHELHRLTIKMPAALPAWWELDREQHRAATALVAIRDAVRATHGMDAPRALVLIEMAADLGFRLAQAHIEPWEVVAGTGKKSRDGGDKGRKARQKEAERRYARWQKIADEKWRLNPHKHISDMAQAIADELKAQDSPDYRSPGRIRNVITKPKQ